MSIRGHGSFENDDAQEWLQELARSSDTSLLKEAFETVAEEYEEDEYVEATDCLPAVAAAEVVAALAGRPAAALPDIVTTWVKDKPPASPKLIKRARRAMEVVLTKSELREVWEESDRLPRWKAAMKDLLERLR